MKKFALGVMVALVLWLLGAGSRAEAGGDQCHVHAHAFFIRLGDGMSRIDPCNPFCPNPAQPSGCPPWYVYWPSGAHLQTPAPISFPYWGSPMTPPQGYRAGGQGYGVPSYWYNH